MSGPSTQPKRKDPLYAPHPDDVDAVREGLEAEEQSDALSPEESEAYLQALLGNEPHDR
jgi:hypothetical protein